MYDGGDEERRRRREEAAEEKAAVARRVGDKKQEPHTEMWGKNPAGAKAPPVSHCTSFENNLIHVHSRRGPDLWAELFAAVSPGQWPHRGNASGMLDFW